MASGYGERMCGYSRRCLRGWLCRPLARVEDIVARQDAVEELLGPAANAALAARSALSGASLM